MTTTMMMMMTATMMVVTTTMTTMLMMTIQNQGCANKGESVNSIECSRIGRKEGGKEGRKEKKTIKVGEFFIPVIEGQMSTEISDRLALLLLLIITRPTTKHDSSERKEERHKHSNTWICTTCRRPHEVLIKHSM